MRLSRVFPTLLLATLITTFTASAQVYRWTVDSTLPSRGQYILCITELPSGHVLVGIDSVGIFSQRPNDSEWHSLHWPDSSKPPYAIHVLSQDSFLIGTDFWGLYATDDGGITWQAIANTELIELCYMLLDDGRRLYAPSAHGIFTSDDRGKHWKALEHSGQVFQVVDLGSVLIGTGLHPSSSGKYTGQVIRSYDRGNSWIATPVDSVVATIATQANGTIVIGGIGISGRSMDSGINWTWWTHPDTLFTRLLADSDFVWAATTHGLLVSRDDGMTWQPAEGGPTDPVVGLCKTSSGNMYAGTSTGVLWVGPPPTLARVRRADAPQTLEIRCIPVPAKQSVTIHLPNGIHAPTLLTVTDAIGNSVAQIPVEGREPRTIWDCSAVPNGIYNVHGVAGDRVLRGRVVVHHANR